MTNKKPSLVDLLSPRATVLHRMQRSYVEKRVVELEGRGYVLYRFCRRESLAAFKSALRRARAEGVRLQGYVPHSSDMPASKQFWIALHCQSGELMSGRRIAPEVLASLGQNVACLHRVGAKKAQALVSPKRAPVPYERFLDLPDLSLEERKWVAASAERFYRIKHFQLSHGDLHARNIIVSPDRQVSLIDYELFAFEPAGLELATMLLRGYCRSSMNRRRFLKAYAGHSSRADLSSWKRHAPDLLFAAALRLEWQSRRRVRILRRRRILFACLQHLAFFDTSRQKLMQAQLADLEVQLEHIERRLLGYSSLARSLLRAAIENPGLNADGLIARAYTK